MATPAGIAARRTGCDNNNAYYGKVAAEPWGVRFPGRDQPRYPAEPLEAILVLLLFAGLVIVAPRVRPRLLFAAFTAGCGLGRFATGFLRISVTTFGPVSADQAASLVMTALGAAALAVVVRRPRRIQESGSDNWSGSDRGPSRRVTQAGQ